MTSEPVAVEVRYFQEREGGEGLEEVVAVEVAAGGEAALGQKTRSEGASPSPA